MVFQPFDRNRTNPDDQAVFGGKSVDAGILGPFPPVKDDPNGWRNVFASRVFGDNPPARNFYNQAFSAKDAQAAQSKIDTFGNQPEFQRPSDQLFAKDFLAKYLQGSDRGLIPPESTVTAANLDNLRSQQPSQGVNDKSVNARAKMDYPGSSGVSPS